ncbi:hypothetical protein PHET_09178 [Paragonimus heterotremus]|uniref:Uncharacterized protein n=1 Tax=Paragonimus heterotremus TaxID=100268 RepID=A0A8J4WUP2_9TREM|nr:hypothetical protein PHET_09178 [Paragonimus heterotremus]
MDQEEAKQENKGTDQKDRKEKQSDPRFLTTNNDYGRFNPNIHTMPAYYYPIKGGFTQHLGICGMYRNHSFNTSNN